jgi:DNA-binding PadR family transcriptional regulator
MHSKRLFRGLLRGHLEHFREMHGGDRHVSWHETAVQRKGRGDPEGHGGGHHHHGRFRGDGFGRRSGFGGRGGGGGRLFGPGDLRLILLGLIAEKPSHGYELIRAIEERVGGGYSPSPGSIYPTLTLLEELGHVRAASSEGAKRLFEITDEGREFIAQNKANIDGITARMGLAARSMAGQMPPEAVHQAMHTLKAALMLHRGTWSDSESDRVRDIIERAAEAISKEPGRE